MSLHEQCVSVVSPLSLMYFVWEPVYGVNLDFETECTVGDVDAEPGLLRVCLKSLVNSQKKRGSYSGCSCSRGLAAREREREQAVSVCIADACRPAYTIRSLSACLSAGL